MIINFNGERKEPEMIPNLPLDWGPELRTTMLLLTLGALLPGALAVAASLLRRSAHVRALVARAHLHARSWSLRLTGPRLAPVPVRRGLQMETSPVETSRLSSRVVRRSVRRHAQRRDPTR
jgi:hypothetical protein